MKREEYVPGYYILTEVYGNLPEGSVVFKTKESIKERSNAVKVLFPNYIQKMFGVSLHNCGGAFSEKIGYNVDHTCLKKIVEHDYLGKEIVYGGTSYGIIFYDSTDVSGFPFAAVDLDDNSKTNVPSATLKNKIEVTTYTIQRWFDTETIEENIEENIKEPLGGYYMLTSSFNSMPEGTLVHVTEEAFKQSMPPCRICFATDITKITGSTFHNCDGDYPDNDGYCIAKHFLKRLVQHPLLETKFKSAGDRYGVVYFDAEEDSDISMYAIKLNTRGLVSSNSNIIKKTLGITHKYKSEWFEESLVERRTKPTPVTNFEEELINKPIVSKEYVSKQIPKVKEIKITIKRVTIELF